MAPADVPEIPSIWSQGSSKNRSSTPQVNAPCAPPPYSARSMRMGARSANADSWLFSQRLRHAHRLHHPDAKKTNLTVNHKLHFAGCQAASSLLSVHESTFRGRPQKTLEVARDGFDACPRNVRVME